SQVRPATAAVIAGTIQERSPVVVRQVCEYQNVLFVPLERLHDPGKLVELAFVVQIPVTHVHAIGHIHKSHAYRSLPDTSAGRKRRSHRIQEGKCDCSAHAFQEHSPRKHLANDHCFATSFGLTTSFVSTASPRRD